MIDRMGDVVLLNDASNINPVNFTLLCIFPLALLFILFFKCRVLKRGEFDDNCWDVNDAKALRVFAAFGVLIHHLAGAATRYGDLYKGPVTGMSYVGILFTSIFFFFSGFGLMRSYMTKEGYLDGFLWKKFIAVGIPFILTNFIYILIGLADIRITDAGTFFTSLFGITLINTNAWYIIEIIILYIAFYFAFTKIQDEKKATYAVVFVAFLITFTGFLLKHDYTNVNGHWFRGEWWFNTTMIFALGLLIGRNRDAIYEIFKKNYKKLLFVFTVLLAVFGVIEYFAREKLTYYSENYVTFAYPQKLGTYLAQTALCACFILFVLLVSMKVKYGNKILSFVAPLTLEIYLIQDICMMNYGYEGIAPDYVIWAVTILATVGAAWLLQKLIRLLQKYVQDFRDKMYKAPDLSFEKRAMYKKERSIVQVIIAFYVVMFIGLVCWGAKETVRFAKKDTVLKSQIAVIKEAEVFDEVVYSDYDSNYRTDGEEDFEWYVIKKEDNRALLLSKYAIQSICYNQKHESVTYRESYIYDILKNEGYYDVFDKAERKYILVDREIENPVFLLSKEEIEDMGIPKEILVAAPSYNAKEYMGIYYDVNTDYTWWWLREEGPVIDGTVVNSIGEIEVGGQEVNRPRGGLRPAIWVSLEVN